MNMKTEKIVMMDSDEAASIQTVTGWVDRQGRFWGGDEHQGALVRRYSSQVAKQT
jgi:hypothetical protein